MQIEHTLRRLFPVLLIFLAACNLQQEIDLELPDYEPEVVVESYLRPGQPFAAVLTRSVSFFDTLQLQYVRNATVVMSYGGRQDTLIPFEIELGDQLLGQLIDTSLLANFGPLFGESVVLYASLRPVPARYDLTYQLSVFTEEGDTLRASTQIPAPIPFESNNYRFNEEDRAILISAWQDNANQANYYRRLLQERAERDSQRVTRTLQDFVVDDAITNGGLVTVGTGFEFEVGDTLISSLYHITRDYWRFIETRDDAIAASLSPFSQPALLHTNIEGGQGIFTGLSLTTDTVFIQE